MCVASSRRRKKNERKRLEGLDRESCLTRRRRSARAKLLTYRLRRHVWRPACDSITTLSDGIRHLGGIRVGLGGWGGGVGFRMERRRTSVTSHCSKPDSAPAVYMPAPWTPGGPREGGRGLLVGAPPPALLSPLPPQRPDPPILHFRCLSSHNHCLCFPPPCRGERDRRDLLALAINPSCQRVNLSPAGLGVRLRLTITASDGKNAFFSCLCRSRSDIC